MLEKTDSGRQSLKSEECNDQFRKLPFQSTQMHQKEMHFDEMLVHLQERTGCKLFMWSLSVSPPSDNTRAIVTDKIAAVIYWP